MRRKLRFFWRKGSDVDSTKEQRLFPVFSERSLVFGMIVIPVERIKPKTFTQSPKTVSSRIVLLHLRRSRDYSEKFFFVRNELDTTLKLHTHTGLMEVSCADLRVGRVPKALVPPSVERSFLLAA